MELTSPKEVVLQSDQKDYTEEIIRLKSSLD